MYYILCPTRVIASSVSPLVVPDGRRFSGVWPNQHWCLCRSREPEECRIPASSGRHNQPTRLTLTPSATKAAVAVSPQAPGNGSATLALNPQCSVDEDTCDFSGMAITAVDSIPRNPWAIFLAIRGSVSLASRQID